MLALRVSNVSHSTGEADRLSRESDREHKDLKILFWRMARFSIIVRIFRPHRPELIIFNQSFVPKMGNERAKIFL